MREVLDCSWEGVLAKHSVSIVYGLLRRVTGSRQEKCSVRALSCTLQVFIESLEPNRRESPVWWLGALRHRPNTSSRQRPPLSLTLEEYGSCRSQGNGIKRLRRDFWIGDFQPSPKKRVAVMGQTRGCRTGIVPAQVPRLVVPQYGYRYFPI